MPDDENIGTRARQRADARARLLRAAKDVFEEKGFLDVRVADIAARAGVSHGLFYHYFTSKQDVFRELAATIDQQLTDTMDAVLDQSSATTPGERLRQAIGQHFDRYRSEARMMGLIEEVSRYDETVKSARDAWQRVENERLIDAIRQLQKQRLADRGLDPALAAAAIGSMTWGFAERWLVRGELDYDFADGVDQITTMLMNALGPRWWCTTEVKQARAEGPRRARLPGSRTPRLVAERGARASMLARHAEHPLADDVAGDLDRAAADARGLTHQVLVPHFGQRAVVVSPHRSGAAISSAMVD